MGAVPPFEQTLITQCHTLTNELFVANIYAAKQ